MSCSNEVMVLTEASTKKAAMKREMALVEHKLIESKYVLYLTRMWKYVIAQNPIEVFKNHN